MRPGVIGPSPWSGGAVPGEYGSNFATCCSEDDTVPRGGEWLAMVDDPAVGSSGAGGPTPTGAIGCGTPSGATSATCSADDSGRLGGSIGKADASVRGASRAACGAWG